MSLCDAKNEVSCLIQDRDKTRKICNSRSSLVITLFFFRGEKNSENTSCFLLAKLIRNAIPLSTTRSSQYSTKVIIPFPSLRVRKMRESQRSTLNCFCGPHGTQEIENLYVFCVCLSENFQFFHKLFPNI